MRAKSTVVIADCASRLSALEPPVSATRKVPPFLTWGAELTGFGAEDPPHAAMPSPGTARAPAAARPFSTERLSISMLTRAGSPLSGEFGFALIGTSLVYRGGRVGRLGKEARRDSEYEAGGTLRREIAMRYPLRHVPSVAAAQFQKFPAAAGSDPDSEDAVQHVTTLVAAARLPVAALSAVKLGHGDRQVFCAREQTQWNGPRVPGLKAPAAVGRADHADAVTGSRGHIGRRESSQQLVIAEPDVCEQVLGSRVRSR